MFRIECTFYDKIQQSEINQIYKKAAKSYTTVDSKWFYSMFLIQGKFWIEIQSVMRHIAISDTNEIGRTSQQILSKKFLIIVMLKMVGSRKNSETMIFYQTMQ